MATPLSDEIRALITYANETTEAGDTKLGDCVKTLVEGYNGGKNIPSSPMVVPSGALSSRIAALLAYANECTGAGDTTMGDAIRTLCEGFGGGELIFYEKLIGDGTAYIKTDFVPMPADDITLVFKRISGQTNPCVISSGTGTYQLIMLGNYVKYFSSGNASTMQYNDNVWYKWHFSSNGAVDYLNLDSKATGSSNNEVSKTKGATNDVLYLARRSGQTQSFKVDYRSVWIKRDGADVLHLVPCTYNGEAGMWDLVEGKFYGNANTSGQFTVEGEIGMVEFFDYLQGDGKSYIVTDYTYSDANDVKSVAANFKVTSRYSSQTYYLFGAGRRNTSSTNKTYATVSNGRMVVRLNANSSTTIYSEYLAMNTDYRVEFSRDSLIGNLYADNDKDGIYEATIASTAIAAPSTLTLEDKMMYIMTVNDGGTLRNIAGTWMYVGEIVIDSEARGMLDYKPCTLNGVAGMLETHDMTFYPAGGSVTAVNRK